MQRPGRSRSPIRPLMLSVAVFLVVILLALALINGLSHRVDEEQTARLTDALRRAAVTCYAVEGRYPATLEYLMEHYGVSIDQEIFYVQYDVIAPNIMPQIDVVWLEDVVG